MGFTLTLADRRVWGKSRATPVGSTAKPRHPNKFGPFLAQQNTLFRMEQTNIFIAQVWKLLPKRVYGKYKDK